MPGTALDRARALVVANAATVTIDYDPTATPERRFVVKLTLGTDTARRWCGSRAAAMQAAADYLAIAEVPNG